MKWLPALPALMVALAPVVAAPIRTWMGAHPEVMSLLGALYSFLAYLLPSPVADGDVDEPPKAGKPNSIRLFPNLLLCLAFVGCSGSWLSRAVTAANTAAEIGDGAASVLHEQCVVPYMEVAQTGAPAEARAKRVAEIDEYCIPLRKAFGVYRAAHTATVAAIQVAQIRDNGSDVHLAALLQQLAQAGDELSHAIAALPPRKP